jgi:hypothetical protein
LWIYHIDEISYSLESTNFALIQRIAFTIQLLNKSIKFLIHYAINSFVLELLIYIRCIFVIPLSLSPFLGLWILLIGLIDI